ncbi:Uu.00g038800.m01.CDS01 [Anthostomella pinea]|uniref:Uu.00g038800.m01.CDS01 n=1 Tax=Anthostomella pinea TaxID=933095 RepID=A0AAI8VAJ1_9PEZI|nr:Uu.00g038800.m01.CDS01 [Anthostomella pinea]
MRLLQTSSLRLESFANRHKAPPYAILSHMWFDDEVLFEDIENRSREALIKKQGFLKIELSARQALQDGYAYIWIDTCCIDKSSSTELSEAINSMSDWYRSAGICYAYLADTTDLSQLGSSRWYSRGWTLQELIMPRQVKFFGAAWEPLGSRTAMAAAIADVTGIDRTILSLEDRSSSGEFAHLLQSFNVATRMAWATSRVTTRPEDAAYCLMGIFDVSMPLLYGEGERAFQRLQMEVVKQLNDTSILAFTSGSRAPMLFASSTADFKYVLPSVWLRCEEQPRLRLEGSQLELDIWLCPSTNQELYYGIFDCSFGADYLSRPAMLLRRVKQGGELEFLRVRQDVLFRISPGKIQTTESGDIDRLSGPVGLCLDKVRRVRITIKSQSPNLYEYTPPAVQWRLETQHGIGPYVLERSEPPSAGCMLLHRSSFKLYAGKPAAHGMASFTREGASKQASRFLLVWGERRYGTWPPVPWCRIIVLQQIEADLDYFPSDIRDRWPSLDAELCVDALFEPFEPSRVAFTRIMSRSDLLSVDRFEMSTGENSPCIITSHISAVTFLERTMFKLDLHIGKG